MPERGRPLFDRIPAVDLALRKLFNASFSQNLYDQYKDTLSSRLGCRFEFRLAETPLFLPPALRARCESAAQEIIRQLSVPAAIERMKEAIPARWDTPEMDALPSFAQVDFAIVRDLDGSLAPRLIELQGFPSLTSFQFVQRDAWAQTMASMPGLARDWTCWFPPFVRESFLDIARRTIVGNHDPAEVVLLDLDPPTQKTLPDFLATRELFGVEAVDPSQLIRRGRRLWRRTGSGGEIPVKRIYNRIVFDELMKKGTAMPFDYREGIDVEWAPHPNWYWVWSKFSLPFLDHWSVPRSTFVSDLKDIPAELTARYVLKPLFSFAGGGVNVEPGRKDLDDIPETERRAWCIQEKIEYEPALTTPDGSGVKAEMRMMFLRPDDEREPRLVQNLVRLSRGKLLGVDFNKSFDWVGSSIGLWA